MTPLSKLHANLLTPSEEDIEQAFGQIVKKFDILSRSIRFQKKEVIINDLHTCIILHNFTVNKQCKDYVSERVYYNNTPIDTVEDEPLSLFGSLEVEAIGSRLYQIDAALHNKLEHHGLMYDLKEHICNRRNNSNVT